MKGKTKPNQSVTVVQIGTVGYRVESANNFLELRMGSTIPLKEVEALIARDINVRIVRNK